jgi:hypothetical protein
LFDRIADLDDGQVVERGLDALDARPIRLLSFDFLAVGCNPRSPEH